MNTGFVTEETGCKYFHPYVCGKQVIAPCPALCMRKAAHDNHTSDIVGWPVDADPVDAAIEEDHT